MYNDLDDSQQQRVVYLGVQPGLLSSVLEEAWAGLQKYSLHDSRNISFNRVKITRSEQFPVDCLVQFEICFSPIKWHITSPFFVVWSCLLCHRSGCWCFVPQVFSPFSPLFPQTFSLPFSSPLHSWAAGSLAWQKRFLCIFLLLKLQSSFKKYIYECNPYDWRANALHHDNHCNFHRHLWDWMIFSLSCRASPRRTLSRAKLPWSSYHHNLCLCLCCHHTVDVDVPAGRGVDATHGQASYLTLFWPASS